MEAPAHQLFEEPLGSPSTQEAKKCAAKLHPLDKQPDGGRGRRIFDLLRDPLLKFSLPNQRVGKKRVDQPIPAEGHRMICSNSTTTDPKAPPAITDTLSITRSACDG